MIENHCSNDNTKENYNPISDGSDLISFYYSVGKSLVSSKR